VRADAASTDPRDVVIIADAPHRQRAHVDYLHDRGADYVFTVKANQPTPRTALARLPWAQVSGLLRPVQVAAAP
jgi:hypothetical protein